jgi:hypothetical protein
VLSVCRVAGGADADSDVEDDEQLALGMTGKELADRSYNCPYLDTINRYVAVNHCALGSFLVQGRVYVSTSLLSTSHCNLHFLLLACYNHTLFVPMCAAVLTRLE